MLQKQSIKSIFNLIKLPCETVPLVAEHDKFTYLLTHWEQNINPTFGNTLAFSVQ